VEDVGEGREPRLALYEIHQGDDEPLFPTSV
jgi:hypothetical protein